MLRTLRKPKRGENEDVEHRFLNEERALLGRLHYLQLQLEQVSQLEGAFEPHVEITESDIQPVGRMTMVMGSMPGAPSTDSLRAATYFVLGAVAAGLSVFCVMRLLS